MILLSGLRAGIRARTVKALDCSLPNRGKRVVFLASLAASLGAGSSFDKQTRGKLNRVMQLAKGDSALVVPFELSKVIWRGMTGVEIFHYDPKADPLTGDMIEQMAQHAIRTMPEWLRYSNGDVMAKDVGQLLRARGEVFGF